MRNSQEPMSLIWCTVSHRVALTLFFFLMSILWSFHLKEIISVVIVGQILVSVNRNIPIKLLRCEYALYKCLKFIPGYVFEVQADQHVGQCTDDLKPFDRR